MGSGVGSPRISPRFQLAEGEDVSDAAQRMIATIRNRLVTSPGRTPSGTLSLSLWYSLSLPLVLSLSPSCTLSLSLTLSPHFLSPSTCPTQRLSCAAKLGVQLSCPHTPSLARTHICVRVFVCGCGCGVMGVQRARW